MTEGSLPDTRHQERHAQHRAERAERRGQRRRQRHSETREEILSAAREVLLERGAADLSLREIARRAGFTPGALYKYFDNKDDVIKTLADEAMAALVGAFSAVPAGLAPDSRAVGLGLAYLAFAREHPEDVAVVEMHESAAHPHPMTADHVALEEAVVGVFRDGIEAGVFTGDPQDAETMAYGAWALVQGLHRFERQQRPVLADKVRTRQRELLTIYVNGLKTDWPAEGRPGSADDVEGT
jgi:AcrR family transcriptional regulator